MPGDEQMPSDEYKEWVNDRLEEMGLPNFWLMEVGNRTGPMFLVTFPLRMFVLAGEEAVLFTMGGSLQPIGRASRLSLTLKPRAFHRMSIRFPNGKGVTLSGEETIRRVRGEIARGPGHLG